jgi:hypothetical protein
MTKKEFFAIPYEVRDKVFWKKLNLLEKNSDVDGSIQFLREYAYNFENNNKIIKKGNNFYGLRGGKSTWLTPEFKLEIYFYEKLDLARMRGDAVKNLMTCISDEDLSLGDKKIIRDIAVESLFNHLNFVVDSNSFTGLHYNFATYTHAQNLPRDRLRSYGFKYRNSDSRIKDFDVGSKE